MTNAMLLNAQLLMSAPGGAGGSSFISNILPLVMIVVVFYFFMIRPQLKKTKETKKYREELKKGDRIITIGGIHGKIAEINDKTFVIEVENGGRVKIEKAAVSMEFSANLDQTI